MNERRQNLEAIFHAATELDSLEERERYLSQACAGDPGLRREVEELLKSAAAADAVFQAGQAACRVAEALPAAILTEKPGDKIGRYKLLEQIGEGGMGVVYMAEQEAPVRRKVALKIIKLGMDTRQVVARFEAERQALALMDHPHIAKILDAGATDSGRPYFVMELVQGMPITRFCDDNQLAIEKRLNLFSAVCQAIQSAHQKGVIHRDIKPSNVLVTLNAGAPHPMVIDFGVAKAINQKLTEKTLFTNFAAMIGTPAYMSPEQALMTSLDIDTRSDIYSLGVLLYELLTGKTPFDTTELMKVGFDEMRRTICETEPPRPSTKLNTLRGDELTTTARHRRIEGPKLICLLRGDVDWIVMKCLEKDRTRRYATANGPAMDIKRFLSHEPIVARPPSMTYRLQKLIRRHRLPFAAATFATAALLVAALVSSWQAVRARRAEARERQLRLVAEAAQENEAKLRTEAERARANEARLREQAEVTQRTAQAEASQLGDVLMQLGKLDEAEQFIRKSLLMQEKLGDRESPELAATLHNLANVLLRQDAEFKEAEWACREALALRRKLLGNEHLDVAMSLDRLAMALFHQGKYSEAEATDREALAIRRDLLGPEHQEIANSLLNVGWVMRTEGRFAEAEAVYGEALAMAKSLLGEEHPYVHSVLNVLADVFMDDGKPADAEPLARECLAIREKKIPDDWLTFATRSLLGDVLLEQQKYDEAEPLLLSAYEGMKQRDEPNAGAGKKHLKKALERLLQLYETLGRPEQAADCRKLLEAFAETGK